MHVKTAEKVQAVVATTTARSQNHRSEVYTDQNSRSRPSAFMEQAADALLLSVFPQSETSRMAFTALCERRLRRAYEGVTP